MRNILAALVAAMLCLPAQAQWTKLDEVHVSTKPSSSRGDIFWTTLNNIASPVPLARSAWNVIDVTTLGVPADAKAIFLSGNLLISHINASAQPRAYYEVANLKVAFRAYGDTSDISSCITCQWYLGHTIETDSGQRSTWATWVPVRAGKIEIRFECTDGHTNAEALSACGINLNVQAWGR